MDEVERKLRDLLYTVVKNQCLALQKENAELTRIVELLLQERERYGLGKVDL